ncbi:MAG: hypothetical protein E7680_03610 [Ruminococcaceae bacterium]|nr:hypothetical protein [Oscillospiraceae bacterium]
MEYPKIVLHSFAEIPGKVETAEKLILSAINAGVQTVGFSYPARTSFSLSGNPTEEEISSFRREITALSKRYFEKIKVLLGETRDFYADPVFQPCDYIIGSVHFLVADDGAVCPLGISAERIRADVKAHFGGSVYQMIRRYFETVALLVKRTHCNYVADFDYLQTFNQNRRLFDSDSPEYRSAALDAMEALICEKVAFEIGIREKEDSGQLRFSPSPDIVHWLAAHGAKFYLSANGARESISPARFLDCTAYAKSCGAGGFSYLKKGDWKTIFPNGKS